MGKQASKPLTVKRIESECRPGYHADGASVGLYLQVATGKDRVNRSWVFRYTSPTTRTRRELGLGSTRVRSLAHARQVVTDLRLMVLDGRDPIDERDTQRANAIAARAHRITFDEAIDKCLQTKSLEWRNVKHSQQWQNTLKTYASPLLRRLYVDLITTDLVYRVLDPIWRSKTETATRLRQRIEVVLDWCKARGYLNGDNPARLKGALGELLPKARKIKKVQHHAAVPYVRVNDFIQSLRALQGTAPLAFEFMVLTAARTGEVVGARWDEIDFNAAVWTIPGERTKAGRPHRVPLASRSIAILRTMESIRQNEFVFPGHSIAKNSHLSTGAFLAVMKRLPDFAHYTPHGCRSCFRDWAAETTSFANETLELALAHVIPNQTEASYRRLDQLEKRTKLMQQWQRYVETNHKAGDVVPIAARRGAQ